ncbi:MAG: cytosine permease [Bacteroidales bacterium]
MKHKRNKKKNKEFEFEAVNPQSHKGLLSMMVVMLGFSFFSASMWAGGNLGSSLSSPIFIFAVIVGNLLLSIYTGLLAYIAGRTNLSTHLLAHYSFGTKGSYLPSILLAITQIGWFGVGVAMFALPVAKLFPEINIWVIIWLSGLLMTITAFFGIKALTILSAIAVPAIIIMGCKSVNIALNDFGGWKAWWDHVPVQNMSIYTAIGVVIATFISGGTLTPDFTRFSKSPAISVFSTVTAFLIGNSLMFIFGAIGASFYQQSDIAEVLFKQGLIVWGILTLGLNIWTTNDNAIYASGLGLANVLKIPKQYIVLVIGIIGTALSMYLYNHFIDWLNFLNMMLPSIGGVLIADYFVINKGRYGTHNHFKTVRFAGIIGWAAGVCAAVLLPGIKSLNSIMIAVIVYSAWTRVVEK